MLYKIPANMKYEIQDEELPQKFPSGGFRLFKQL